MPNPSRFKFSRSRCTSVASAGEGLLKSSCRLVDTFADMRVEILVKVPEMEVQSLDGSIRRSPGPEEQGALEELSRLKGIRVGPGMTKIFKGLVTETTADSQILFMVEEACHGVILTFTREMACQLPDDQELSEEIFKGMVKSNIRLYNRCAAYAPGSPLVEGIQPPR